MQSALPTRPTPPPTQKPVDGRDHGDGALVDRAEGGEAAPVGADQGVEALGVLHLLDVDAGVEALALGAQHHHVGGEVAARLVEGGGDVVPALDGQRVHRREVHRDDADPVVVELAVTPMDPPVSSAIEPVEINQAFAWYSTRVSISVDLAGRVALVTGGSQGIGAGIAAVLVRAGATVVTCARSAVDDPAPGTTHVQCDVRDPEAVTAMVDGDRRRARSARHPGQQRRRVAVRPGGGRLARASSTRSSAST